MKFFNCAKPVFLIAALLLLSPPAPAQENQNRVHHLIIQITENDPDVMALALNNAANVSRHYGETGEEVEIELVAYGPGLHMLRKDTSPVKARLKSISESLPNVSFSACGNTMTAMEKQENKPIPIIPQARIVQAGVVRIMELQEQGWSYLRP